MNKSASGQNIMPIPVVELGRRRDHKVQNARCERDAKEAPYQDDLGAAPERGFASARKRQDAKYAKRVAKRALEAEQKAQPVAPQVVKPIKGFIPRLVVG